MNRSLGGCVRFALWVSKIRRVPPVRQIRRICSRVGKISFNVMRVYVFSKSPEAPVYRFNYDENAVWERELPKAVSNIKP
jgi:hypothetical protein